MGGIDSNGIRNLSPYPFDGSDEALPELRWQNAWCDCDAAEVSHFVRSDCNSIASECAGSGSQDKVERVLGVDSKAAYLRAFHGGGLRNVACLLAVSEQAQTDHIRGRKLYWIPLENDGCLRSIATAQDGR
ncbi:hypothetical protein V491_07487 [Pseudogymnoascus sp. VKM F-3775]|nr:hypothetical protein V491_07487 [Pseudogymnoascus sp. VKM F-3775]